MILRSHGERKYGLMNKVRVLLSFVLIALCGLFMFGGMDCSVAFMEEEEYSILEREIAPSPNAEPEKEEAPSKEEKETAAENVPVSEEETEIEEIAEVEDWLLVCGRRKTQNVKIINKKWLKILKNLIKHLNFSV